MLKLSQISHTIFLITGKECIVVVAAVAVIGEPHRHFYLGILADCDKTIVVVMR